ncbi:MAG TPA: hypothetical protein VMG58_09505 [Candidatus Sulfotelmatobacter sp.]|nr:hypothetical protein [Candidatus Sulfotelmatobacter sp.]
MHIITGLLLTALLKRKPGGGSQRLPTFPGVLETVHVLPGRIRVRAPSLVDRRSQAEDLQNRLARLDGVQEVAVSTVSGSVCVHFASDRVTPELLLGAIIRLLGLERQLQRLPRSVLGQEIREGGEAVNRAIHAQTGGLLDLWTTVPLVLAGLGVRNVATGRAYGWPMLWWAYRSLFPPNGSPE